MKTISETPLHQPPRRTAGVSEMAIRIRIMKQVLGFLCVLLVALACACGRGTRLTSTAAAADTTSHDIDRRPYPRGAWRLAPQRDLDRSVVWLSHIVIMHRDSKPTNSLLRALSWAPDRAVERSREAAYKLALDVARQANAHPEQFAELAKKYSDDLVTRDTGGSLGGKLAPDLPALYLDALAVLAPGQVSEVLETTMGFHVLLKRAVPPVQEVSAHRIVIRYESTAGDGPSSRSHADALQLARTVSGAARSDADFAELIVKYSESPDVVRGGDLGTWSTTDPGPLGTVIETLARLKIGECSEPIDTREGFQILKRELPSRQEFGARYLVLEFDERAADSAANSQTAVHERALAFAATLQKDPSQFEKLQGEHCCRGTDRWSEGHGNAQITAEVASLGIGAISTTPLRMPGHYLIAQRLDPAIVCARDAPILELPAPATVDVDSVFAATDAAPLLAGIRQFAGLLVSQEMTDSERPVVEDALRSLDDGIVAAQDGAARVDAYRAALASLHDRLPEASYAKFTRAIQRWLSAQVREAPRI